MILRMKALGLPEIEEFPFMDPPAPKAISEGYRTLREVGALDRAKNLTDEGYYSDVNSPRFSGLPYTIAWRAQPRTVGVEFKASF